MAVRVPPKMFEISYLRIALLSLRSDVTGSLGRLPQVKQVATSRGFEGIARSRQLRREILAPPILTGT